MPIRDTFGRNGRWDGVGIDCDTCRFCTPPPGHRIEKPFCAAHEASLDVLRLDFGFPKFEAICSRYESDGRGLKSAIQHLQEVKSQFADGVLYIFPILPGDFFTEIPLKKHEKEG